MPNELPQATELWEGEVSFFSIDTDLIQSAGYNFTAGALNQLPAQLPAAMELQLTEVVVQELIGHQMTSVLTALTHLASSSKTLERTGVLNMGNVTHEIEKLNVEATVAAHFRKRIVHYAERCGGGILPIEGVDLAATVFELYFKGAPPFGLRKDKKAEFPDATSVVLLENYARERKTKGIVASRDNGVAAFAAQSDFIYCVKSLEELATLFVATGEYAQKIKSRFVNAISDENSDLREQLSDAIVEHINNAIWVIRDISSSTVSRVEGEAYDAETLEYEINDKQAEIWESKDEPGLWIVELMARAKAEVSVDVSYFVWDSIDREEIELVRQPHQVETFVKFKIFMSCSGITETNSAAEWQFVIDIATGKYQLDVGEVNPDFSDEAYEE